MSAPYSERAYFPDETGKHNHGDGLTALDHARQHRANITPERRAELDREWADAPAMKEGRCG